MANKQRLIDANALSEKIGIMKFEITRNRGGYRYCNEEEKNEWDKLDSFDSLVCDAPTVDAVEVVRCADCVLEGTGNCPMVHRDPILGNLYCTFPANGGYCSKGVRRGKDAVD